MKRKISLIMTYMATVAMAAPPGLIDGRNIPDDFGFGNLQAVQRNYTSFGNYTIISGGLTQGNETNGLYLAKGGGKLYVGITGNLATNGNAWMIGIGVPGRDGQTENRTEGVGGPPFTLQDGGRQIIVDDNGTPDDATDDTWSYGANGTIFPIDTDYILSVDTFGGTCYMSEYTLFPPDGPAQGTFDPTTGNTEDTPANLYATRNYLGSTDVNDGNGILEGEQGFGYGETGFNNTNILGVTDLSGSNAASANTGLEVGIPFSRIGNGLNGTETIQIFVMLGDGSGGGGALANQTLPSITDAGFCNPANGLGQRPDLPALGMTAVTVNLNTLGNFVGVTDGTINAAEYGAAKALQTCPTSFGDQQNDPEAVTRLGGSELNALYVTSDATNLYVGITGNLQENGNKLILFIDSVTGGVTNLTWDGLGGGGDGLEGDFLPPLQSDPSTNVQYDYAISINASGTAGSAPVFVDLWNITEQSSTYKGNSVMETGNGNLNGGSNQWGMQVALDNLNNDGVIGCGFFQESCYFDLVAQVEAAASTATRGIEMVIPLADIGINPCDGAATINLWALVTGGGGFRSNQSLPSMRDANPFSDATWMPGSNPTDWYKLVNILPEEFYRATAATHVTTPGISNDCDGNLIEDVCDILANPSLDANVNGIIDSCEEPEVINIVSSVPANNSIDPRQPSAPDGSNPAGISVVVLTFDGDTSAVVAGDFSITATNGIPPQVNSVVSAGNTVTLTMSAFIPVNEWTTITHTPSGTETRLGYLPGDVNNDGTTAVPDVLALINSLNGINVLPLAQTDIDRSGTTNAADVLREIDLLNGAGSYQVYNGASLP